MSAVAKPARSPRFRAEAMRIGGERVSTDRVIEVLNPWSGEVVGTVPRASVDDVRRAFAIARPYRPTLSRYERSSLLLKAASLLRGRVDEASDLITLESGLCKKDSVYEVGRVCDVLTFAGMEALRDDGQSFSCDLTPHGKSRRVFTRRDPLLGVIRGDRATVLMVDDDGTFTALLTGPDALEMCRTEVTDHSQLVGCRQLTRQK